MVKASLIRCLSAGLSTQEKLLDVSAVPRERIFFYKNIELSSFHLEKSYLRPLVQYLNTTSRF
jgi:hypothetical protein